MSRQIYDEPMERKNLFLPLGMWEDLQQYASELSQKEGKPVSVAEAQRRINERFFARRNK